MRRAKVFTIPPGVPFLEALAAGVLADTSGDPLALARYRILLPTRRAVRALAEAFLRQGGGRAMVLPRLTPIGDIDDDEISLFSLGEPSLDAAIDCPPAIGTLRRRILLARLVERFGPAAQGRPYGPDHALRLADELARLLDQVETERLDFARLPTLVPENYARHWQITLDFLRILSEHWPHVLAEEGVIDPADRRNRLLAAQAEAWRREPPGDPVIAAGSTGSIPATADLLGVVARLPKGAVILPGLDRESDAASWAGLDPSHPQFGLARLLDRLGLEREQVRDWRKYSRAAPNAGRLRLLAEAMRPTPTTDAWRKIDGITRQAVQGLRRIDCPTPNEEAAVIALLMRETLEHPGKTASLVTPDRDLARRVAAELRRWNIEIDDSAGMPVAETPSGAFLRLLAVAGAERFAPVSLLSVLKHPLAAGGEEPAHFRRRVRVLELFVLRGPRPGPGLDGLLGALSQSDAPPEVGRDLRRWIEGLADMVGAFAEISARTAVPIASLLDAHMDAAERLATTVDAPGTSRLWQDEEGEALATFVAETHRALRDMPPIDGRSYPALFDELLGSRVVRPHFGRHPRLQILGPLEARLQHADRLILGGLNEGTWPRTPAPDPWMSRPMERDFGLPEPERRIGLSAHDFVQALAAMDVVFTRAQRVEGTPTVPSRWLMRLDTVLDGAGLLGDLRESGAWGGRDWLGWQALLDRPATALSVPAPAPRPPFAARPRELSVTAVGTWMRNPYAIYARYILRLKPLDPLEADPGAAERGTFIHAALHAFLKARLDRPRADDLDALLELGRQAFGAALARPSVYAFWWPRFERIAAWFLSEQTRRTAQPCATEIAGRFVLDAPSGRFTVTARADRIDRATDGRLVLIDYKTGGVPTGPEVEAGLEPQLPLEAAIARAGGFPGVSRAEVAEMSYWRLSGGEPPGEVRTLSLAPGDAADDALRGLENLFRAFDDPKTAYIAHPDPERGPAFDDYAHLARVKEWSAGDGQ
jgi:ATP-dependent helicase/nuclease subunit B